MAPDGDNAKNERGLAMGSNDSDGFRPLGLAALMTVCGKDGKRLVWAAAAGWGCVLAAFASYAALS